MRVVKEQLKEKEYIALKEKTKLKEWVSDDNTARLLKLIDDCNPSYRFMRQLSRTSLVPSNEFDSSIHHNLLSIETIFNHL